MGRTTFLSTVYPKLSAGRQSEGHVRHLNRDEISRRPLRSAVGTRMPAASRGAVLRLRQIPYRGLPRLSPSPTAAPKVRGPAWGARGLYGAKHSVISSVELSKSSQSGGLSPHPTISRGNHAEPTPGVFFGENVRSGRTRWGRCGQLLTVA